MYCTYPKVLWHQQQIGTIITKWVNICHMIVLISITQVSNTNSLMKRTYVWHNYGVDMLWCKQYSSKYELHKIKIFHSHTSLAWRETKNKNNSTTWKKTSMGPNIIWQEYDRWMNLVNYRTGGRPNFWSTEEMRVFQIICEGNSMLNVLPCI